MAALPVVTPRRASRRTVRDPRGRRLDVRATLRRARATGGDRRRRQFRRRTERPRHLVLVADVSGSMAPYARAYLHLLHGAVRASGADAFVFATRLTRLTRQLRPPTPTSPCGGRWPRPPTGRAGPASPTRCGSSTTATAAGGWPGGR